MLKKTVLVLACGAMAAIASLAAPQAQADARLPVPMDYQDYALSCEVAALKMALLAKGLPVNELQLMAIMGQDAGRRQGNVWADPNQVYVGSLHGRQNSSGYGVHWDPIARTAQVFLPNSLSFTGWSVQQLAAELAAGNPVVIWGVQGRYARPDSWYTPEGKLVRTWVGEHARTVTGFRGTVENPTAFYINDPWYGQLVWSRAALERNWAMFGNAGVAVR